MACHRRGMPVYAALPVLNVYERQEAAAAREPHATIASPLSLARRRQRPVAVRLRRALLRAGVPAASAPSYAVAARAVSDLVHSQ